METLKKYPLVFPICQQLNNPTMPPRPSSTQSESDSGQPPQSPMAALQGLSATTVTQSISSPALSAVTVSSPSVPDVRNSMGLPPPLLPVMDEGSQAHSTSSFLPVEWVETPKPVRSYPLTPITLPSPGGALTSSFCDEFESVSSPSWSRATASPRPDDLFKLYDISDDPARRFFLDKLITYQEERGTPLSQCPTISKQPLDLYRLYLIVKERGGFAEVMEGEMWKEIAGLLGIGASSGAAYTLRLHYIKHLLPYECKYDRGGIDPVSLASSLVTSIRKKNAAYRNSDVYIEMPCPKRLKTSAVDAKDDEGNNLLHRIVLAFCNSSSEEGINAVLRSISCESTETVNALNEQGYSPLHLAVLNNKPSLVNSLLSFIAKIDVDAVCASDVKDTPLHIAVKLDHSNTSQTFNNGEMVKLLLDYDADVDAKNAADETPLHSCFEECVSENIIKLLLEYGADVNAEDEGGQTPLHCSLETRASENIIKILIKNGANCNAKNYSDQTPLHYWAWDCDSENIFNLLIDNGADVNEEDFDNRTPLHVCIANGASENIIKSLIENGADVSAWDKWGGTPLHICVDQDFASKDIIKVLIENGADVNAKNGMGKTPLHIFVENSFVQFFYKTLVENRANVKSRNDLKDTPFHICAEKCVSAEDIIKLLIEHGADVNAKDDFKETPLHSCVDQEYYALKDMIKVLIENGADVNAKDRMDKTLLDIFVENGADVNAKDDLKKTSPHFCVDQECASKELIAFLKENGADVNAKDRTG